MAPVGEPRRSGKPYLVAAAALAVLAAVIVWQVAGGPDSDWVVGVITAAPAAMIAFGLALVGHRQQERPPWR